MKISVIKSSRKTISVEVKDDETVIVRAPKEMSRRDIDRFIDKHEKWISDHTARAGQERTYAESRGLLSCDDIKRLADEARKVIPERVRYYAAMMCVSYERITIRCQRTRWGSCSAKGNLNFNCLLMLMPAEILDYVVVHELAHRKQLDHSPAFWSIVESVLPDYRSRRDWLRENGGRYMRMIG